MEQIAQRLIRVMNVYEYDVEYVVWSEQDNGRFAIQFTTDQVVPEMIFKMRVDVQLTYVGFELISIERLNVKRSLIVVGMRSEE